MFPPPHPFRRRLSLVVAGAATSLLAPGLAVQSGAAQAQPERPAGPVDPQVTHKVSLITGDVVTVTTLADGKQIADVDRPDEPGAVLLQRSGLLAALDALFEAVWGQAHPLELSRFEAGTVPSDGGESDAPTALDRQILTLMLAGLTDQAVAAQLDLSLRTVQRRLRHLQDLAGVKSRMQLGWYAGRNGWA